MFAKSECELKEMKNAKMIDIGYMELPLRSNEELKRLVRERPVTALIRLSPSFLDYKSGILTEPYAKCSDTKDPPNHAVVIVGFGDTSDD